MNKTNSTIRLAVKPDRLTRWLARAAVVSAVALPGCFAEPASEEEIAEELARDERLQETTDPEFCYFNAAGHKDDDCPAEEVE